MPQSETHSPATTQKMAMMLAEEQRRSLALTIGDLVIRLNEATTTLALLAGPMQGPRGGAEPAKSTPGVQKTGAQRDLEAAARGGE